MAAQSVGLKATLKNIRNRAPTLSSSAFSRERSIATGGLVLILLLGIFLRFYQLGALGVGNTYYAAAVKSMLTCWKNFFFVAFEPGGSISLDKPPLGFWVQTLFAYFLGVNGFALALPNAIAGVLSIFMVFKLVSRPFGRWIGLVAALAQAIMPVAIATERNNTIDGLLVFVLLLAAWSFLQSIYTGKDRWLFLGSVLVGLGFNIKMLQAFLPLPAFYAIYLFGAKHKWGKRILHLAASTALLLVVSFSWAVVVDLVPVTERPYVDSTSNNSVMELIFGHNGIERLLSLRRGIGMDGRLSRPSTPVDFPPRQSPDGKPGSQPFLPFGQADNTPLPNGNAEGPAPMVGDTPPGGQPGSMDFGSAGTLRLFTQPLVGEASWLLPVALGGLAILAITLWRQPFGDRHITVILWAGWLLPETIYFTYSQGLMHAYYLIMMGPPIAALTAMTFWALWRAIQTRRLIGWGLTVLMALGMLAFQVYTLRNRTSIAGWVVGIAAVMIVTGLVLAAVSKLRIHLAPAALSLFLAALFIAPAAWSALTTLNSSPNEALPYAGPAQNGGPGRGMGPTMGGDGNLNQVLLSYLLDNTLPGTYLLATDRASEASSYILATGRPVLTFRGFLGQYDEITVDQLSTLVKKGQLRFVLNQSQQGNQEIAQWVQQNCKPVEITNRSVTDTPIVNNQGRGPAQGNLFDCGG